MSDFLFLRKIQYIMFSLYLISFLVTATVQAQGNDVTNSTVAEGVQNVAKVLAEKLGQNTDKNLAAKWMRGAFHDAATGSEASLEKFPNTGPNRGLGGTLATSFVGNAGGSLSKADIIQLGGIVAVKEAGGPDIKFTPGRKDNPNPDEAKLSQLPAPSDSFDEVLRKFRALGLNRREALVFSTGSHTLGGTSSGATFDDTPNKFDNNIFQKSLKGECVIPFDCQVAQDRRLRPWVETYANNQDRFFRDYAEAYEKFLKKNTSGSNGPPIKVDRKGQGAQKTGTQPAVPSKSPTSSNPSELKDQAKVKTDEPSKLETLPGRSDTKEDVLPPQVAKSPAIPDSKPSKNEVHPGSSIPSGQTQSINYDTIYGGKVLPSQSPVITAETASKSREPAIKNVQPPAPQSAKVSPKTESAPVLAKSNQVKSPAQPKAQNEAPRKASSSYNGGASSSSTKSAPTKKSKS